MGCIQFQAGREVKKKISRGNSSFVQLFRACLLTPQAILVEESCYHHHCQVIGKLGSGCEDMTGRLLHAYGKVWVGDSMSSSPACIEDNGANRSTLYSSEWINLYSNLFSILKGQNSKIAKYCIPELDSIGRLYGSILIFDSLFTKLC